MYNSVNSAFSKIGMGFPMNGCYDAFLHRTLSLRLSDFNFRTSGGHMWPDNIFYVPSDGGGPINAICMSRNPRKRIAPITTWITSVWTSIIFIVEYSSLSLSRARTSMRSCVLKVLMRLLHINIDYAVRKDNCVFYLRKNSYWRELDHRFKYES